jgi:hypothetical protein
MEVEKSMHARLIAFYTMDLSTKTLRNPLFVDSIDSIEEKMVLMMRTATKTDEKAGLKNVLILSSHSLFEALIYKQGVKIVAMAQREA